VSVPLAVVCADTGITDTHADASAAVLARKILDFIKIDPTKNPDRLPRQRLGVRPARKRAATLLAGIRAGGATSIAFPSACSERSVAVMEAEFKKFVHLPLRGQRRLGLTSKAGPSCFPLNCGM
jgi:hypothetical protein